MRTINKILFVVFLIYIFTDFGLSQNFGGWIILDSTIERRGNPASTILANGNFLISGGSSDSGFDFTSCEIFDTLLKSWRFTNPMLKPRIVHKMITLNNGKVLALGGFSNNYYTRSCELFDPVNEIWLFTDSMLTLREFGYTITVLKDSNVLITGGWNRYEKALNKCEIYDIKQNKWRMIDTLRIKREQHTATLLSDGRVLIAGGGRGGGNNLGFCEIYDPIKDSFYLVRQMNIPRHQHSAVLLPDGKVLVSGGRNDFIDWLRSIEVYDPQKNLWFVVDSLVWPRTNHYSIILNDSLILFGGGSHNSETWEIYDYKNFRPLYIEFLPIVLYGQMVHSIGNGRAVSLGGWQYFFTGFDVIVYPSRQVLIYDPLITFVEKYESKQVKAFALYQNYPNPFNPITTIKFSLPEKTNVKISVYNLLGQKVKELLNETRDAGTHTINFDGSGLPSGIYFYKIEAGKYTEAKKMILMK
ncbi:MAG: kelch repeat-containing protein [Ignavibacteria bacterium]